MIGANVTEIAEIVALRKLETTGHNSSKPSTAPHLVRR